MRKNDITALHQETVDSLKSKLIDLTKQLEQTKLDILLGKVKNVKIVEFMRRDIARLHTVLGNKERL